nr:hypothetical protein [uncultured Carboxylicivirga sp.]
MIKEYKENNTTKVILRIVLILLGIATIITVIWINTLVILVGLYLILMSFLIKDRCIQIFKDRFELNGKSILPIFNSKETFNYSDIKKIEFSESYTDIFKSVLKSIVIDDFVFIGNSGYNTYSKPDTITVVLKDDSFRIFNRIGSKNQFLYCFKTILEEINKQKSTTPNTLQ